MDEEGFIQSAGQIESDDVAFIGRRVYDDELFLLRFLRRSGCLGPNVSYAVNDNVTYDGKTYKAIQAHTSLPGWEPPNVPALWQFVQGGGGNDTAAPTTPTNVIVSAVTSSSVTLSWQASTDNVGVTGYDVYQGTSLAISVTGTTATITGLSPNTTYSLKVIARMSPATILLPV